MSDDDKMTSKTVCNVMVFKRNKEDFIEDDCAIELADSTPAEIELAFTFNTDRYYLRIRKNDLKRLLRNPTP